MIDFGYIMNNDFDINLLKNIIEYYNDKDYKKCYDLCMQAGEDKRECSVILGFLFVNGDGVERDLIKGIRYFIYSGFPTAKKHLPTVFMICL